MNSKNAEAIDGNLISCLIAHRTCSKSQRTQKAAEIAKQEMEQMRKGSAFGELCAWYFSNICSGYGYVVRTDDGLRSRNDWITPKQLLKHLGGSQEPIYLAIRPPTPWTNWAVIDIDEGSRYHPLSENGEGVAPVLEAVRGIGLQVGLEFQSSRTGGIHIWFPMKDAVLTWDLAVAIQDALTEAGLEIRNGVLEARPNQKSYNSQYQAIRAPLTGEGNALFIESIGLTEELAILKQKWIKAKVNRLVISPKKRNHKKSYSSNRRGQQKKKGGLNQAERILEAGFTGKSQTQCIKLAAMQKARLIEELDTEHALRERSHQLIEEAPGYKEHCRHKKAIKNRTYISRSEIKKALSLIPGGYRGTWKEEANTRKRENSKKQAQIQVERMLRNQCHYKSRADAFLDIKKNGGPSRSWWYKRENATYLSEIVKRIRTGGHSE